MGKLTVLALRVVIVMLGAGSLFVQSVMVPIVVQDEEWSDGPLPSQLVAGLVIVVLGVVAMQVVLVCVWKLVTMVKRGTVFSNAAFRYVDVVIGAFAAAAVLVFAFGFVLAPGEEVPPGMVLLVGGVGIAVVGIALVVLVMRALLAQAVARDAEATQLRDELDEVI
ncbi:DUF2975 domain-containing protein [Glycomyces buryatensis]|uniref:DUF2975 domain-containing protein n=1 Tax=Glycomyces buryatensis TaxID=2570927 RepID=A0A4V4HRG6_9ACTN|nr:DUF2975 domain-containing protein [Glycomyces buryatensis]THV37016.1 DUF2975 domain-containing protein [Glycomyces buryatensis]